MTSGGNSITVSGSTISHGSTAFATITSNSTGNFLITFNASASAGRITALIKQVRLQAASRAIAGARALTTTLSEVSDGDSVTEAGSITISFMAVDD